MNLRPFWIAIGLLVLTSNAYAESILATAAGSWRGDGWARQSLNDPKRTTKCRFSFNYSENDRTLSIDGKCAGGGRAVEISGRLTETVDGKFEGRWQTSDEPSIELIGVQEGDVIWLNWKGKNPKTREIETYWGRWNVSPDRISISSGRNQKRNQLLSDLGMQRR